MPIGKNSIKRVANNGYSAVKTDAPDMQNSTVITNIAPQVAEVMLPKAEEKCDAPKKKTTTKKKAPTKAQAPVTDGFARYSFGDDLPVHLL